MTAKKFRNGDWMPMPGDKSFRRQTRTRRLYRVGVLGLLLTILAHAGLYWLALWALRDAGAITWDIAWWRLNIIAATSVIIKLWMNVILVRKNPE